MMTYERNLQPETNQATKPISLFNSIEVELISNLKKTGSIQIGKLIGNAMIDGYSKYLKANYVSNTFMQMIMKNTRIVCNERMNRKLEFAHALTSGIFQNSKLQGI